MDKMDTIYGLIVKKRLALSQPNFYKAMAVVLIIFTLAGCTERIEIELDSTYARLSVEGYITTDTMAHWVRLTETADYYNATPPPPVVDAIVEIDDGENIITLTEYDSKPGYYFTSDDYFGVPGRTYDLNIQLSEDINGKKNYTATSELKPVASLDSITIVYNPDFEGWEVRVFALDPPTEDFYSFQVYKNGILQSDTINEISITDDRFFNGSYLNGVPAYFMRGDDADIQPGDVITLKMGGITKDFFTFVAELRDETFKFRNPLFSGPPANIISNISGDAVGYFTAYASSYASTVYEE
jgi:hypothetical protein